MWGLDPVHVFSKLYVDDNLLTFEANYKKIKLFEADSNVVIIIKAELLVQYRNLSCNSVSAFSFGDTDYCIMNFTEFLIQ